MKTKEFLKLPILLEQDEDWVWVAESPVFDWLFTQWYYIYELQENLQDISNMYFQMIKEWKRPYKASKFINLTYNKNGEITNNISKEINKNIEEKMIQIG
jgi:predicted RNase H-like HicB family nuclease